MSKLSYQLNTDPSPDEIGKLWMRDDANRLLGIVHISTTYGATLEVIDFEHYGDYLGNLVKAARIIKAAKCTDIDAVKTVLDGTIEYEFSEQA